MIFWPIAAIIRRHYGRKLVLTPAARRLRFLTRLACLADVLFLVCLTAFLSGLDDPGAINSHGSMHLWIHLMQVLGLLGAIGSLAAVWNAVHVWRAAPASQASLAAATSSSGGDTVTSRASMPVSNGWIWSKISATIVALGCICLAWFFIYWNLLNFNLNY